MKFVRFVNQVYEPKLHFAFALLWSASLVLCLYGAEAGVARLAAGHVAMPAVFFLVLLFLRAIDEIKDYDYDRVHKPDRPLVTGLVTFGEVRQYAWGTAGGALLLSAIMGWGSVLCAAAIMAYGVFLLWLERHSAAVRDRLFLNLLVTFPVSSALNFFAIYYVAGRGGLSFGWWMVGVALAYMGMFLHFEFGRKTLWPRFLQAGERVYAQHIGGVGSALVALGLAMASCWVVYRLYAHALSWAWVAWLPLGPTMVGVCRFLATRHRRVGLYPYFVGALLLFYLVVTAMALSGLRVGWAG